MNRRHEYGPITDEDLVAYIDGMLDDGSTEIVEREIAKDRTLDARLSQLREGDRPFAEAFDSLLITAPKHRLAEILDHATNPPVPPVLDRAFETDRDADRDPVLMPAPNAPSAATSRSSRAQMEPWRGWRLLAAAVVLFAVFAAGIFAHRFGANGGPMTGSETAAKDWRATVAEYQALFVKATLEQEYSADVREANLRSALSHLGLDFPVSRVTVDSLEFRRAEVLNLRGRLVVQMAYLYAGETPFSFCIIRSAKPTHDVVAERREGLNIAHWQSREYGYMVIGDVPADVIGQIARKLRDKVS